MIVFLFFPVVVIRWIYMLYRPPLFPYCTIIHFFPGIILYTLCPLYTVLVFFVLTLIVFNFPLFPYNLAFRLNKLFHFIHSSTSNLNNPSMYKNRNLSNVISTDIASETSFLQRMQYLYCTTLFLPASFLLWI